MNNKITIYELLGLVKDGQAPKKVLVGDTYYEYNRWGNDYNDINMANNYWLFKDYLFGSNGNRLNDEVEILDNEDEDIEEIKEILRYGDLHCPYGDNESMFWKNIIINQNKINELVRQINKLKKEKCNKCE